MAFAHCLTVLPDFMPIYMIFVHSLLHFQFHTCIWLCLHYFFFVGYDHCLFHDFRAILNQVCPFVNLTLHIYPHRVLCPCAYAHLVNMTFHGLWICFVLIISMLPCALLSWYPCLTVHDYYPCLLSILVILCFPLHCWADIHAFCPCPLPMLAVSTYRLHSFMCIIKLISICLLPYIFISIFF